MIIDNTYFKNEIYIPQAKPSMTSSVTSVAAEISEFIAEYVEEALIECLGSKLAYEFISNLDSTKDNGLKDSADAKWNTLLNGEDYIDSEGESKKWKGIRYKSIEANPYNKSLLAYYVYYFFERDFDITRSNIGNQQEEGEGGRRVSADVKTVKAFNKFIDLVQGKELKPVVIQKSYGHGIDYYNGGQKINMYQYIQDKNALVEDTYEDFNPKVWRRINQFGI